MHESAASPAIRLGSLAGLLAVAIVVMLIWVLPGSAQAASVVGPSGQITSCYKKKGKAKGALRVVPAGKRCKKGEKRLTWNGQGPQGQTGGQGGTGTTGGTGGSGDNGLQSQITDLKSQITQLTSQLTALSSQLNQLCAVVPTLVTQLNSVRTVLNTLSLGGVIPIGLVLNVTGVPAALPAFACP